MRLLSKRFLSSILILGSLSLSVLSFAANQSTIPLVNNLSVSASEASKSNEVLVVFFMRPDCPYCTYVEDEYLTALFKAGKTSKGQKLKLVKVDQSSAEVLIDFKGKDTTHANYAKSENVKVVPVVGFYDNEGRPLDKPIIGTLSEDYYLFYLEKAIESSGQKLKP